MLHQGMKLIFFSDSHLAPKFFKVVANSKKVGCHFHRQTKAFFFVLDRPSKIKLGKRSLICYKVDTRMDDKQCFSSPKSKMASSYQSIEEVCCGFIFTNIFNLLYLLVRLWWNILVTNLATNFRDLVAKVKNLVTLVPVLGAISCPVQSWSWNKHMPLCKLLICFNGDKDIVTSFVWNQWWWW